MSLTIEDAISTLKEAGYTVVRPSRPRQPPGAGSWYRSIVASRAMARGWTGGSNPEDVLSVDERTSAMELAKAYHLGDLEKSIYGGLK